jgi:hypothetical protein
VLVARVKKSLCNVHTLFDGAIWTQNICVNIHTCIYEFSLCDTS